MPNVNNENSNNRYSLSQECLIGGQFNLGIPVKLDMKQPGISDLQTSELEHVPGTFAWENNNMQFSIELKMAEY